MRIRHSGDDGFEPGDEDGHLGVAANRIGEVHEWLAHHLPGQHS